MVNPNILQKILIDLKIPINTRKFIFNIMTNRNLYFKIDQKLEGPYFRHIGVPQGCVLSPILYLIYVLYLNKHIFHKNDIIQFADDTIIIANDTSISKGLKSFQENANKIIDFFQPLGLEIAPQKLQLIIFSKSYLKKDFSIKLKGDIIKNDKAVKYLGMWIDAKLEWNIHAQYIIKKIQQTLNIIKVLRATWWGGHPQILLNVFKGLLEVFKGIRSVTDYNCYCINIQNIKYKDKLNKLEYKAIRLAMGYRNSTPINILHADPKNPHSKFEHNT